MINNPKIIERIKRQLQNTTKEQLNEAMKLVYIESEEYNKRIINKIFKKNYTKCLRGLNNTL